MGFRWVFGGLLAVAAIVVGWWAARPWRDRATARRQLHPVSPARVAGVARAVRVALAALLVLFAASLLWATLR